MLKAAFANMQDVFASHAALWTTAVFATQFNSILIAYVLILSVLPTHIHTHTYSSLSISRS